MHAASLIRDYSPLVGFSIHLTSEIGTASRTITIINRPELDLILELSLAIVNQPTTIELPSHYAV